MSSAFNDVTKFTNPPLYKISTPSLLKRGIAVLAAALLGFFLVISAILYDIKTTAQTIVSDTAPSVIAAQQIKTRLASMDASVVNAALLHGAAADDAWKDLETDQRTLSEYLVAASKNITFGANEEAPLIEIDASLQSYSDVVGQARNAIKTSEIGKHGQTADTNTLNLLRHASEIMSTKLLPAADALNAANETVLNATWETAKAHKLKDYISLMAISALTLSILTGLQIVTTRRTNRKINLAMLTATIFLIGGVFIIATGMTTSDHYLRIAKEDAFDSVRSLWKTRAIAYSANADESYFLLDPERGSQYTAEFEKKIEMLAGHGYLNPDAIRSYDAKSKQMLESNCKIFPVGGKVALPGLIGDELSNITFDNECKEAANLIPLLSKYVAIDKMIHILEGSGNREAALALDLGNNPGQSNYLFGKFNTEIGVLIDMNQIAFIQNARQSRKDLLFLETMTPIVALVTLLLAWLGVRPRIREYPV